MFIIATLHVISAGISTGKKGRGGKYPTPKKHAAF